MANVSLIGELQIRGMTVGYEPWKVLVQYRVAQTKQSRRGQMASARKLDNELPKPGETGLCDVARSHEGLEYHPIGPRTT